jgi:hypothetical protein
MKQKHTKKVTEIASTTTTHTESIWKLWKKKQLERNPWITTAQLLSKFGENIVFLGLESY